MKVVVYVKRVPDTEGGVKLNPDGMLDRSAMLTVVDSDDKAGLEVVLRLEDRYEAEITVITMGLPKANEVLREALIIGADRGILITDRVLEGADTWATFSIPAGGLRKLEYNLIITEWQAIDGDTAQAGLWISEHLDIPVISCTQNMGIEGDHIIVERQFEDRYRVLRAKMPYLAMALSELNQPRYITLGEIFHVCGAKITVWGRQDLKNVGDGSIGLKGPSTQIVRASDEVRKGVGEKVELDAGESAPYLICKLTEKRIISYQGGGGD